MKHCQRTPSGLAWGLWALPRPLTRAWGQGREMLARLHDDFGSPTLCLGARDTVPGLLTVDCELHNLPTVCARWESLPFRDRSFTHVYWDPPYLGSIGEDGDVHYNRLDDSYREAARVSSRLLTVLSPLVYPKPKHFRRAAVIAVTYGPNKVMRALQVFRRNADQLSLLEPPRGEGGER